MHLHCPSDRVEQASRVDNNHAPMTDSLCQFAYVGLVVDVQHSSWSGELGEVIPGLAGLGRRRLRETDRDGFSRQPGGNRQLTKRDGIRLADCT